LKELKKKELKDFRTSIGKKLTRLEKLMDKSIINYFNIIFLNNLNQLEKK